MRRLLLGTTVSLAVVACAYHRTIGYPTHPQDALSIVAYGAIPDGITDATTAIKKAIKAARSSRRDVFIPAGIFVRGSFSLDGVGMAGVGAASVLLAPRADDSNIYLRGSGSSLRNLTIKVQSNHRDARNNAVFVDGADRFLIESVSIYGANASGIFDFGGSNGRIVHNRVENTLADAIHNTRGAHDVVVSENIVRHAGDDMISVVSYLGEPLSHNILIEGNNVADQDYGRGISVVGGRNITIQDNQVARTNCCAGIYIASEANWNTAGVENVLVRGNELVDNSGETGHGSITISAEKNSVRNVSVKDNIIIRARHSAVKIVGNVSGILIDANRFSRPVGVAVSGDRGRIDCVSNLLNDQPMDASVCGDQGIAVPKAFLHSDK